MDTTSIRKEATPALARIEWTKKDIILSVLAIGATIILCAATIYYRDDIMGVANIASYSLLGVLVISLTAGSLLSLTAIPVPYWLLVFTLPSTLTPQWGILAPIAVGLASALGSSLGHLPTFMLGYGGRSLSNRVLTKFTHRFHHKIVAWVQKHAAWASFLTSAVFNPLHLPITIAIGALHFSPLKFFFYTFLGNTVKSLFLAFSGYFGLNSLLRFLEI
jgi:membrane protein DedA with SNARE-associated domain